ncbi:unnamed protein product [Prorocentrum cordatum]|uniref:Uncharacterized protein n=1 Tax=Prorocentrum cordatum TaxID=2364126 RepID=A0ABN9QLT3_9DINO|nr:unnamed protein product [Polarella glacialis]
MAPLILLLNDNLPACLAGTTAVGTACFCWLRCSKRIHPQESQDNPRELGTLKELRELVSGKRALHVKGFGGGFGNRAHSADQETSQVRRAVQAIRSFGPDYLVVDGDPWGDGFQRYVKAFADERRRSHLSVPELVWVKDIKGDSPTSEERTKKLGKASEWAKETGLRVVVSWLPESAIANGMNSLFGTDCSEKLKGKKFDVRGEVRLLSGQLEWVRGMAAASDPSQIEILRAIEAVESRESKQYFEKCSFENSAKGNAIYQHLRGDGHKPDAHGAVSFGGGESVLLEFATLYLFPGSGFDREQAALLPLTRGRGDSDPKLPEHEGSAFRR